MTQLKIDWLFFWRRGTVLYYLLKGLKGTASGKRGLSPFSIFLFLAGEASGNLATVNDEALSGYEFSLV